MSLNGNLNTKDPDDDGPLAAEESPVESLPVLAREANEYCGYIGSRKRES